FVGYGVSQTQPHFILCKNRIFNNFRFNAHLNALNQGEGSVFRLRKCVFRIPRLKLPLKTSFLEKKIRKNFFRKKSLSFGALNANQYQVSYSFGDMEFTNFEQNTVEHKIWSTFC